jgi:glutathione S-transferase
MGRFLVCLSDRRPDILAGAQETAADIWCYEIEAEDAGSAVAPAVEQWREQVGERVAVSLSVSQMSAPA